MHTCWIRRRGRKILCGKSVVSEMCERRGRLHGACHANTTICWSKKQVDCTHVNDDGGTLFYCGEAKKKKGCLSCFLAKLDASDCVFTHLQLSEFENLVGLQNHEVLSDCAGEMAVHLHCTPRARLLTRIPRSPTSPTIKPIARRVNDIVP